MPSSTPLKNPPAFSSEASIRRTSSASVGSSVAAWATKADAGRALLLQGSLEYLLDPAPALGRHGSPRSSPTFYTGCSIPVSSTTRFATAG